MRERTGIKLRWMEWAGRMEADRGWGDKTHKGCWGTGREAFLARGYNTALGEHKVTYILAGIVPLTTMQFYTKGF